MLRQFRTGERAAIENVPPVNTGRPTAHLHPALNLGRVDRSDDEIRSTICGECNSQQVQTVVDPQRRGARARVGRLRLRPAGPQPNFQRALCRDPEYLETTALCRAEMNSE